MQIVFIVWSLSNVNENTKNKTRRNVDRYFWAEDLSARAFLFIFFLSRTKMLKEISDGHQISHFKEELGQHNEGKSLFLDSQIYLKFWINAVLHIWPNSEAAQGDGEMSLVHLRPL